MARRPSIQFYPGDWLRSTDLRSCSVGARGLWIDMICLMHEGNPYGYLKVGNKVILPPNLAQIVGASLAEVEGWLKELSLAAVYSESQRNHVIFSRRMVRDEKIRESRAKGGILGGNPALMTKKDNLPLNLEATPSSSSSSSSSSSKNLNARRKCNGFELPDWVPAEQWNAWVETRTKARKAPTDFAKRLAVAKLEALKVDGHHPAAVLAQSAFNGWSGLFAVKPGVS